MKIIWRLFETIAVVLHFLHFDCVPLVLVLIAYHEYRPDGIAFILLFIFEALTSNKLKVHQNKLLRKIKNNAELSQAAAKLDKKIHEIRRQKWFYVEKFFHSFKECCQRFY
jgi:hypothetical protein